MGAFGAYAGPERRLTATRAPIRLVRMERKVDGYRRPPHPQASAVGVASRLDPEKHVPTHGTYIFFGAKPRSATDY